MNQHLVKASIAIGQAIAELQSHEGDYSELLTLLATAQEKVEGITRKAIPKSN